MLLLLLMLACADGAPRPIPVLLDVIHAPAGSVNERTKHDAVLELARHNSREAAIELRKLTDDEALGGTASRAFNRLEGPEMEAVAVEGLTHASPRVRRRMLSWMIAHGSAQHLAPLARQAKTEKDPAVRADLVHAVNAIAMRSGSVEHVELYTKMLDDPDLAPVAREWLYTLRDPKHAALLHRFLADPQPKFRGDVARRLGRMKSPDSVGPLMKLVSTEKDPGARRSAMEALVDCASGPQQGDVAKLLVPMLDDDGMADAAAYAMGKLRHPDAGAVMLPALKHPKSKVRARIAQTLGEMGYGPAGDALARAAVDDADDYVKRRALIALGSVASSEAHVRVIADAIDVSRTEEPAMQALKKVRNPVVTRFLFPLLKHPSQHVRREVCSVLGSLAEPVAAVPLMDSVEHDDDGSVKSGCAEALGSAADVTALPRMLRLIEQKSGNGMSASALHKAYVSVDRTQRLASVQELVKKKHPAARALVIALVSDPHPVDEAVFQQVAVEKDAIFRRDGLLGLGSMRTPSAREALCRAVEKDPDPINRTTAAEGLGHFPDDTALECLVGTLETLDPRKSINLKEAVVRSLQDITGQKIEDDAASWRAWMKGGRQGLVAALSSSENAVRIYAARALLRDAKELRAAVPAAIEQLGRENNEEVRIALVELLGKSGDARAKDAVLGVLDGKRGVKERIAVARALDALGDGRGTLAFIEQLDSDNPAERAEAVEALSVVTGEPPHPQAAWWKQWWKTYGERYRR